MNGDDRLGGFANCGRTDVMLQHVELIDRVDQSVHVAADSGDDRADQFLAEFGRDLHDHAVVHQHDSRIGLDQDIAGMGIRMEKTVDQKLPAVKLDEVFDHSPRVDVVPEDFIHLIDTKAFEELHDQNAGGGDLSIDSRNNDEAAVTIEFREPLHIIGLVEEVHFFGNHPRKFVDDRARGADDVMVYELFKYKNQVLDDP